MGARPFRMANSQVRVRLQLTGAAQPLDDVYGGKVLPVTSQFAASPLTMFGQPRFTKIRARNPAYAGDSPETDGYIVFSMAELDRVGITDPNTLKHAIVSGYYRDGGWVTEDFQIVEVRFRGHMIDIGPIIIKCFLKKHFDVIEGAS